MRGWRFVAGAALLGAALAGCGDGSDSDRAAGPVLEVGSFQGATHLDPAHASAGDSGSALVTRAVFENLVRVRSEALRVEPALARSWTASGDGRTWIFRLAPARRFSDGTPVDAAAVKFNFDRWRLTANPYHGALGYPAYAAAFGGFDRASAIAAVDARDSLTVRFRLRAPVRSFLLDLAFPQFGIGSPAAIARDADAFDRVPVGSGPYSVVDRQPEDYVRLGLNRFWHGAAPAYPKVIVRFIPDRPTGVLALEKFDIDVLAYSTPDEAKTLEAQPGVVVYRSTRGGLPVEAEDSLAGVDTLLDLSSLKPKAGT